MPALTVSEIAAVCEGEIQGDGQVVISGANTLEAAGPTDLAFADGPKAMQLAAKSEAGCLITAERFPSRSGAVLILVKAAPRLAFARALRALYSKSPSSGRIHPTAIVSPSAIVPASCSVGPYTTLGDGSALGEECTVGAGCSIGARVSIGARSTIHDRVTIYEEVTLGARVVLHSGSVIGADGFGFALAGDHYEKFPQVGTVEIGDDVEVGANSCIDRAALGVTRIGAGTKLDNLVHVAHNCEIGKHVVVAAQTGFSGSVTVGDYAVIGGQVGVGDKASIASKSVIGGQAGIVSGQRIDAGEPVWGTPARPLRQHLKGLAHVGKFSQVYDQLKRIEKRLKTLETTFGKEMA